MWLIWIVPLTLNIDMFQTAPHRLMTHYIPEHYTILTVRLVFDIIFPEHYSIFVIYERNHAFGLGYTDNIYIALGYLPHKDTEYAFSINGSENLMSQFKIKKNINGYDLSFNLNDDLTNLGNNKEASINLNKVF